MRVIKNIYNNDASSLETSHIFDEVIQSIGLPLSFDSLQFNVGYGFTEIENNAAAIGISPEDLEMVENDRRAIKTMITFEIFRIFVRKRLGVNIPLLIEDILVGRDMIKKGYGNDLTHLYYIFMLKHRVKDKKDFLRLNVPWIIFHGNDEYYCHMFRDLAKNSARFSHGLKTAKLFTALKKDLWNETNLRNAINVYGDVLNAGN
jgi:hypothetical protein